MAEATRTIRDKVITTIVPETVIMLTLTGEEAATLRWITQSIGGDPTFSRRAHADNIGRALLDAGLTWVEGDEPGMALEVGRCALYFRKTETNYRD